MSLGSQTSQPTTSGQKVPDSGQQMHYPMLPGLQVTYPAPPGQPLPHQMAPGSPILPHPISPDGHPLQRQAIVEAKQQEAGLLYYRIAIIVLAAILVINAVPWFIVYTISASNSDADLVFLIIIAVAFASSIFTNSCEILCVSCNRFDFFCYVQFLMLDFGLMLAVTTFAAILRFIPTAIVSSMAIMVKILDVWMISTWNKLYNNLHARHPVRPAPI